MSKNIFTLMYMLCKKQESLCPYYGECAGVAGLLRDNIVSRTQHHLQGLAQPILTASCDNEVSVSPAWR